MEILLNPDQLFQFLLAHWPTETFLQGSIIIFLSLFIEDATTLFVATLVSLGKYSFIEAMIWLSIGISLGDGILYYLGVLMRRGKMKTPEILKNIRLPLSFIFGARFVPGTRMIAYAGAGILRTNIGIFSLLAVSSSILWTYGILKLVTSVNASLSPEQAKDKYGLVFIGILIILIGLEVILGRVVKKHFAKKELET